MSRGAVTIHYGGSWGQKRKHCSNQIMCYSWTKIDHNVYYCIIARPPQQHSYITRTPARRKTEPFNMQKARLLRPLGQLV